MTVKTEQYFVAPNGGSDEHGDGTRENPFRTYAHLLKVLESLNRKVREVTVSFDLMYGLTEDQKKEIEVKVTAHAERHFPGVRFR